MIANPLPVRLTVMTAGSSNLNALAGNRLNNALTARTMNKVMRKLAVPCVNAEVSRVAAAVKLVSGALTK